MRYNCNRYLLKNKADSTVLLRNAGHELMKVSYLTYNCGSFALGRYNTWYKPYEYDTDEYDYIEDIRADYDEYYIDYYDCCTKIGRLMVDYMCQEDDIREISSSFELDADEYLVLFKASYDDFHYARRMDNGDWYHKMGNTHIEKITEDDAFSDDWWSELSCNYDGQLFYLAVKKRNIPKERLDRKRIHAHLNKCRKGGNPLGAFLI